MHRALRLPASCARQCSLGTLAARRDRRQRSGGPTGTELQGQTPIRLLNQGGARFGRFGLRHRRFRRSV
eukprot:15431979-Alexandrium_andersonii.AAC.1